MCPLRKCSAAFVDSNTGDNCECQTAAYKVLTQRPQGCSLGIPRSSQQSLKIRIKSHVECGAVEDEVPLSDLQGLERWWLTFSNDSSCLTLILGAKNRSRAKESKRK